MTNLWKADLRWHDGGRLSDRTITHDRELVEAAFRGLLGNEGLIGEPVAARLVSPITGTAIYYSRFDRELGEGRIHPWAPLNLDALEDLSAVATMWLPGSRLADWELHPEPFSAILIEWTKFHGWKRQEAADQLRVPLTTFHGWCAGRGAAMEKPIRRLMTLIDQEIQSGSRR